MTALHRPFQHLVACGLLAVAAFSAHAADSSDRDLITRDGGEIDLNKSVPGAIEIDASAGDAIALLSDAEGLVVAAAGAAGQGRVIAFSHGSFFKDAGFRRQTPVVNLVVNAVRWAGKSGKPSVAVHPSLKKLAETLTEAGCSVEVLEPGEVSRPQIAVYCIVAGATALDEADYKRLTGFTAAGGGLVVVTTPWAYAKKFSDFADFPGNRLLANSSIRYLPRGYAKRDQPLKVGGASDSPAAKPMPLPVPAKSNTDSPATTAALALAERHQSLSDTEQARLMTEVEAGAKLEGAALYAFLEALLKLNHALGPIVPTKKKPINPASRPQVARMIRLENQLNQTLPAGRMYALPAAADYPGAVPENAERTSLTFTIDGKYRGWLSGRPAGFNGAKEMRPTGVYAAPGELVMVTVPADLAGKGFEVIIGSYKGSVEKKDTWRRYLQLMTRFPIEGAVTQASNALGGLVNIRVPNGANFGAIEVTIDGGVRAPLYVHGITDLDDWKKTVRNYPAPWAELASKRMIIALPSDHIRGLDDPDQVLEVWNGLINAAAKLVAVDRASYRAERLVFDRQISAGGMHSGYPVAAHLGSASAQAVNAKALKSDGNWGFFHEYGHNHQHNLWALPGTGETTCNLWSVYLFEEYIGKDRDNTHRAINPLNRRQRITEYFGQGANFESWSVWTALETYLQIQEEFGWEPFIAVFDEYNQLSQEEWPKTQQEKNDQFVIRLSRAAYHNLAPFWSTWGLPLSDHVAQELSDLPVWEDHPVANYAK